MPSPSKRTRHRDPTVEETSILRLLSQQSAIPMDQLARFLEVDRSEAKKIIKELAQTGCIEKERPLQGDASWVWLNHRGARLSRTGFSATKPALSRLAHLRAVNEARLLVSELAPDGLWVCERELRRAYPRGAKVPDGVLETEGERHAIEVELTPKSRTRLRQIISEHRGRHDVVVYFCSPQALRQLQRIKERERVPELFVRALPGWSAARPKPEATQPPLRARRGEPTRKEIPILDLIAEQGAIPLDQFARFLNSDLPRTERFATHLQEEGLIRSERFFPTEPDWIWLSKRGARFSTKRLSAPKLRVGALPMMRATNEVRLWAEERLPANARWISRRLLLRGRNRNASVPRAVLKAEGQSQAIEVHLAPGLQSRVEKRLYRRMGEYDVVICFCAPKAKRQLERLKEDYGLPKVVLTDLPEGPEDTGPED